MKYEVKVRTKTRRFRTVIPAEKAEDATDYVSRLVWQFRDGPPLEASAKEVPDDYELAVA